jgi:AGZA family xanthine/uracil permease-like MFS transporter
MATTEESQQARTTDLDDRPDDRQVAPGSQGTRSGDNAITRFFELEKHNVTVGSEIMAGLTTFLVMAYIAFVNPGILTTLPDSAGLRLDFGATVTATCWVASVLCILMGIYAKRPFAMAPGMGLNAVVMFQLVAGAGLTWAQAFGIIFLEGVIITALVLTNFRQAIMDAVPMNLKRAIAAGIGLFILYIGLNNGGIVAGNPVYATDPTVPPVGLGNFATPTILVTLFGLLLTVFLEVRKQKGAILWGILGATVFAVILNYLYIGTGAGAIFREGTAVIPSGVVATPTLPYFFLPDLTPFTTAPITSSLNTFSIMLSDFFDTMGTLVGVGLLAGFLNEKGQLPGVQKPLLVDSLGPVAGGLFGASSATTYIESGAGVSEGGRTGLVAVTVGILFLLVPFFTPIIAIVPAQATAPALILVGFFMLRTLKDVDWADMKEALPVLITMIAMPLTYSITNGIGFGFILFTAMMIFTGAVRKIHWLMWVATAAFVLYFMSGLIRSWVGVA